MLGSRGDAPGLASLTPTRGRLRLISIIIASALFMQGLDSTVITTALPTMARAFHADPVGMNVALTAYLFAVALFIPASGWLADRFGTRRVLCWAIGVFTLGSVLCGRADTLAFLVVARVIQGAGGAMMVPVGRLVLLRTVPTAQMVGAMSWVTIPGLVGPVIGPPIGGLIVSYFSWRWIFDINVPFGMLGVLAAWRFIPDSRVPGIGRLDVTGMLLSGASLAALLAVLELVGRGLVGWPGLLGILVGGLLAGGAYAVHAASTERPVLDFTLMRLPSFSVSVIAGSLFRVGVGAQPFLLPLMLQLSFGKSPAQSGMITFASALGAIFMKPATTITLRRFGFRSTLAVNGVLCGLMMAVSAAFRPDWPIAAIYVVLLATGFLRSLQFTAYNTIAYADVPPARMSAATTLYAALQQISLTVGIPISAGVLEAAQTSWHHATPTVGDFGLALLVVSAISVLAGPFSLGMPADAGAEMAGRAPGR